MDQLFTSKINNGKVLGSLLLLMLGFLNLSYGWLPGLAPYSLALTGFGAFGLTFSWSSLRRLFAKPIKPVTNFLIFFVAAVVVSMAVSFILQYVLNLQLRGNPLDNHIPWLQLPFMLLGEELLSFYIFVVAACFLKKSAHYLLASTLLSALVFACLHIPTYWNGSFFTTLVHVLLLQGVTRMIFNAAGVKANALWVPWLIHIAFDVAALGLVYFS